MGCLFDIDVIRTDETKVSVQNLAQAENAFYAATMPLYAAVPITTVKELLDKACELMKDYFEEKYSKNCLFLSMQALLYGKRHTQTRTGRPQQYRRPQKIAGIFTFEASAVSANHYFEKFALCGMEKEHESSHEPIFLYLLQDCALLGSGRDAMTTYQRHPIHTKDLSSPWRS